MLYKFFAKTLFLGKKVYSLPECHSTNAQAALLVSEMKAIEGTVVISEYQTSGKGQRGNSWESERGKNIILSIILKPTFLNPSAQFSLHTICSLAIYDTLFPHLGAKLRIKWPNDVYYEDRKLCGILIENSIRGSKIENAIIGIGLNVNQTDFKNENAVSLKEIAMRDFERADLLEDLLLNFEKRYLQLKNNQYSELRTQYLSKLYKLESDQLFHAFGQTFQGKIKGINQSGMLLIEDHSEVKAYEFKEVEFVRN